MNSLLKIAHNLALPVDAVTKRIAHIGSPGSGKSYAAMKLAEQMLIANAQIVALDPVGIWYSLRIGSNGKGSGFDIPVFGGLHGDIPLDPAAGALIADVIVDRNISAVVDVSQMIPSEQSRFATAFAAQLFQRRKAKPKAMMLFIEECQEFIPQNPMHGEEKMLSHFQRISKIGRNFGIGIDLISQRPQDVNKKVLNLSECLFCFQMLGSQEREVIKKWIAEKAAGPDSVVDSLLTLDVGTAHVWSPRWLKISEEIKIGRRQTFDASSTPEVGVQQDVKIRALNSNDLENLRVSMAAMIERAKSEDPTELRAKIKSLEKQITTLAHAAKTTTAEPAVARAQPKIDTAALIERAKKEMRREIARRFGPILKQAKALSAAVPDDDELWSMIDVKIDIGAPTQRPNKPLLSPGPQAPTGVRHKSTTATSTLPSSEHNILVNVYQYGGLTRNQLTTIIGLKRSTRDAYVARLTGKGLLTVEGDKLVASGDFESHVGNIELVKMGSQLLQHWIEKSPKSESEILAFIANNNDATNRNLIGKHFDYKESTRNAYIARLKGKNLITEDSSGSIWLAPELVD